MKPLKPSDLKCENSKIFQDKFNKTVARVKALSEEAQANSGGSSPSESITSGGSCGDEGEKNEVEEHETQEKPTTSDRNQQSAQRKKVATGK